MLYTLGIDRYSTQIPIQRGLRDFYYQLCVTKCLHGRAFWLESFLKAIGGSKNSHSMIVDKDRTIFWRPCEVPFNVMNNSGLIQGFEMDSRNFHDGSVFLGRRLLLFYDLQLVLDLPTPSCLRSRALAQQSIAPPA